MSIESLTYTDLGGRLGASPEAARSLSRRLRLPRTTGKDGKVRVTVDLTEISYRPLPARAPAGHQSGTDVLNAQIEQLQAELIRLEREKSCIEAIAAAHRVDFERERERCDELMAEALKLTAIATSARERAARFEGELIARCSHPWWRRGVQQKVAALPAVTNSPSVAIRQLKKPETRVPRHHVVMRSLLRLRRPPLAGMIALIVFAGLVVVFVHYGIPILAEP